MDNIKVVLNEREEGKKSREWKRDRQKNTIQSMESADGRGEGDREG